MSISGLSKLNVVGKKGKEGIKTRNSPRCQLCFNHGINSLSRGHKRECIYAMCACPKCTLTNERRWVMRMHMRQQRRIREDDSCQTSLFPMAMPLPTSYQSAAYSNSELLQGCQGLATYPPPSQGGIQQPIPLSPTSYHSGPAGVCSSGSSMEEEKGGSMFPTPYPPPPTLCCQAGLQQQQQPLLPPQQYHYQQHFHNTTSSHGDWLIYPYE
ncbi:doublesex- and mab-3-related transcription factor dmd-10-like [Antedon mediterranea]|uniref:doublesex- and mab-3-related transcription factor dmd-10-like n=1 Tax=Antedon mediterranea TaxID=105859 RepID=UPI003AF9A3CC